MSKKLLAVLTAAALVCALGARGLAETRPEGKANEPAGAAAKETLRADISKLVADARAGGRGVALPRPQIQTSKGNNLSRSARIGIGVGIAAAVAVIVLVVVNRRCDNEPGGC